MTINTTNKIYCFDLDDTLCSLGEPRDYNLAKPIEFAIAEVNRLYDTGNIIKIFTARGTASKIDYTKLTKQQLEDWGVKYDVLIMNKPSFDITIDDKAINAYDWHNTIRPKTVGFLAGNFDVIHPGYIMMFQEAKKICNHLIVGLHEDPTLERPGKNKPVQSLEERKLILSAIKYIDEIIEYKTEQDLYNILKTTNIDIRILGLEYKDAKYTGHQLGIPVYFLNRNHNYSATKLKREISESFHSSKGT